MLEIEQYLAMWSRFVSCFVLTVGVDYARISLR